MDIQALAQQYIYWPEIKNKYQQNIDFSKTTLEEIAPMLETILSNKKISVEESIIKFYTLNEALALLRKQEHDILNTQSVDLYKSYQNEIKDLSQNIFAYIFIISIMEARHCYDLRVRAEAMEDYLFDNEANISTKLTTAEKKIAQEKFQLKAQTIADKKANKFLSAQYKSFVGAQNYDNFLLSFQFMENVYKTDYYSRNNITKKIFPLMQQEPFSKLTIEQFLSSLSKIFQKNEFSSGYGGEAWANIATHALNFSKGVLNAEVFVDQAFSLEHNSGQIFNKDIIFKEPDNFYLNVSDIQYNMEDTYSFSNPEFLLNLQHNGQLISFITKNLKKTYNHLNSLDFDDKNSLEKTYKEVIYKGIISSDLTLSQFNEQLIEISNSMETLEKSLSPHIKKQKSLIDFIKTLNLPLPSFSLKDTLDMSKEANIDNKDFCSAFDYFITPQTKIKQTNKVKPFIFEYLDTSNISNKKMKKEILGNKAFGLAEMQKDNLPVPRAMVFPATNAHSFFNNKKTWLKNLKTYIPELMNDMKDEQGNPLLCSVRSGSAVSMPGMMDTILNVGIDDSNYDYFCEKLGKKVTDQCAIKFMDLFCKSYLGEHVKLGKNLIKALIKFNETLNAHGIPTKENKLFPLNAKEQYKLCVEAVFSSWNSERAMAYRNHQGISHDIGTAAIVQQMVFGNLNNQSCTGVVFSRDCINGKSGIIGEFLPNAQGEDVVSGAVTPKNITELKSFNSAAYKQLVSICEELEKKTGDIQDIEFTIEDGELYILQKRKAVCSNQAQQKLNEELYKKGLITKEQAILSIEVDSIIPKDFINTNDQEAINSGLVANPGILRGIVIHKEEDMEKYAELYNRHKNEKNFGWIFYSKQTSPDHAPLMLKTHAFVTSHGGFTSHAAILARSWNKPCVVGVGKPSTKLLSAGSLVTMDATNGHLYDGILPLAGNNNKAVKQVVDNLLKHYNVDTRRVMTNTSLINEINEAPTWMESYPHEFIQPKIKANTEKFMSIGNQLAIILLKQHSPKIIKGIK